MYEKSDEQLTRSDSIVQNANRNLQNLQSIMHSPESSNLDSSSATQSYNGDQILAVRNLVANSMSNNSRAMPNSGNGLVKDQNKVNKSKTVVSSSTVNNVVYAKPSNVDRTKRNEKTLDKTMMELNLTSDASNLTKKNIKGVKLIGMEGGTLRRPSLQVRFKFCSPHFFRFKEFCKFS